MEIPSRFRCCGCVVADLCVCISSGQIRSIACAAAATSMARGSGAGLAEVARSAEAEAARLGDLGGRACRGGYLVASRALVDCSLSRAAWV